MSLLANLLASQLKATSQFFDNSNWEAVTQDLQKLNSDYFIPEIVSNFANPPIISSNMAFDEYDFEDRELIRTGGTFSSQKPDQLELNNCPKYLPISNCFNLDTKFTICYWNADAAKQNCPYFVQYQLFYMKKSDRIPRIYTCQNTELDQIKFKTETKFSPDFLAKYGKILKNSPESCSLSEYDSKNLGTTYEFYVARVEAAGMVVEAPKNANLLTSVRPEQNLVVNDPPVIDQIKMIASDTIVINFLPPENFIYDFGQIELDYKLEFRKIGSPDWVSNFVYSGLDSILSDLNTTEIYEFRLFCSGRNDFNVWSTASELFEFDMKIPKYELPPETTIKIEKLTQLNQLAEARLSQQSLIFICVLSVLLAVISILIYISFKNAQKIKFVLQQIPKPDVKVKLGRDDQVVRSASSSNNDSTKPFYTSKSPIESNQSTNFTFLSKDGPRNIRLLLNQTEDTTTEHWDRLHQQPRYTPPVDPDLKRSYTQNNLYLPQNFQPKIHQTTKKISIQRLQELNNLPATTSITNSEYYALDLSRNTAKIIKNSSMSQISSSASNSTWTPPNGFTPIFNGYIPNDTATARQFQSFSHLDYL